MTLPAATHIVSVTLRSGDLPAARRFYGELAGLTDAAGEGPPGGVALGAGGGPALVRLEPIAPGTPAPPRSTGLFHTALRYPTRAELAAALLRVAEGGGRLSGASDHGVSEALYLDDPEGNGVELYWDRPREVWPRDASGRIEMFTAPLDLRDLLEQVPGGRAGPAAPAGTDVGHVHLRVSELERSRRFYRDLVGFEEQAWLGASASFVSAGGYHHHIGMNTWQSEGAGQPPPGSAGLERVAIALGSADAVDGLAERLDAAGVAATRDGDAVLVEDPDGIALRVSA
jgi:catechol 2,3-dioxygenase